MTCTDVPRFVSVSFAQKILQVIHLGSFLPSVPLSEYFGITEYYMQESLDIKSSQTLMLLGQTPWEGFHANSLRPKQNKSWMKSALSYQWPRTLLWLDDSAASLLLPAAWCQRTEHPNRLWWELSLL